MFNKLTNKILLKKVIKDLERKNRINKRIDIQEVLDNDYSYVRYFEHIVVFEVLKNKKHRYRKHGFESIISPVLFEYILECFMNYTFQLKDFDDISVTIYFQDKSLFGTEVLVHKKNYVPLGLKNMSKMTDGFDEPYFMQYFDQDFQKNINVIKYHDDNFVIWECNQEPNLYSKNLKTIKSIKQKKK